MTPKEQELKARFSAKPVPTPSPPASNVISLPAPARLVRMAAGLEVCADITVSEMTRKHTVTEFSSLTSTEPIRTHRDLTWPQLVAAVAPSGGIPSADKTSIPLYIAGALKAAPWVGKTRERKDAARAGDAGVPSEGIQRSNGHVVCLDAAVGDVDDDPEGKRCSVWDVSRRLQKLSVAHIAYKSWSGIAGRSESGRIVAAVDRSIMSDEYVDFFRAWEELCGNQLDNQGRARSQAYFKFGVPEGTSAVDAAQWRKDFDGFVLSVDKMVAGGS